MLKTIWSKLKTVMSFTESLVVLLVLVWMALNPLYFAIWLTTSLTLLVCTYMLYAAIMHMEIKKDELFQKSAIVRWTCYGILFIGLVFDTLLDWIFLTFSYYEFPREFLSTERIRRHKFNSGGLRKAQSMWWCYHWLIPFDGRHCD